MTRKLLYLLGPMVVLPFLGCNKDRLTGSFDRIEGRYQWYLTEYFDRNCLLCQNGQWVRTEPEDLDYLAEIEFTDEGRVIFYIDNEEYIKRRFTVLHQEELDGQLHMQLKVDVSERQLDIHDEINLSLITDDTLIVSEFPGSGYDKDVVGTNYFSRIE